MESSFNYLEYEKKISSIVSLPIGNRPIDKAVLLHALSNLSTTRFFTKHASHPDWLKWLDENNVINSLFEPYGTVSEIDKYLAQWMAESFVIDHWRHFLQLISKRGNVLNPYLWEAIAWQLTHRQERPDSDLLAIWVTILLKDVPPLSYQTYRLDYLLNKCRIPGDSYSAFKLLSYLLTPIPVSEYSSEYLFADTNEIKFDYKLTLRGNYHWLNEGWNRFKENLNEYWRLVHPMVTDHLMNAYQMNVTFGKAKGDDDVQSFWRSGIEDHSQDIDRQRSFDVLINTARDLLEFLLKTDALKEEGISLIESWFSSGAPILKRIAIHGVIISDCWNADDKIKWLIKKDLLYVHWYKHETFRLIKKSLRDCSETVVKKLVSKAKRRRFKTTDNAAVERIGLKEFKALTEYEKFNLFHWMSTHAPNREAIESELVRIKNAHPNFQERDFPDLDHWSTGFQRLDLESPKTADQLKALSSKALAKFLSEFKVNEPPDFHESRSGLLNQFSIAITSSFDWSIGIANQLVNDGNMASDIWTHLIRGWINSELSEEDWVTLLNFLIIHDEIHRHTQEACELLEKAIKRDVDISDIVLSRMEDLSDKMWSHMENIAFGERYAQSWLSTAINHGAGNLTEFWIQALHKKIRKSNQAIKGFPNGYLKRFDRALSSNTYAGYLASSVIGSRIHYFLLIDREWTFKTLLPLFSFEKDLNKAQAVWDGYLTWGQIRISLIDPLKPLYLQAIENLEDTEDRLRGQLFEHLVIIMLGDTGEVPDFPWFYEGIKHSHTSEQDRLKIADKIWLELRSNDDGFRKSVWNRVLKKYWSDRLQNEPIPLSTTEADKFIGWIPWLAPVFDEAVELVLKTKDFRLYQTHFYSDLQDTKLMSDRPLEVARVLEHLLSKSGDSTLQGYYLKSIYEVLKDKLNDTQLFELANTLKRLGVI